MAVPRRPQPKAATFKRPVLRGGARRPVQPPADRPTPTPRTPAEPRVIGGTWRKAVPKAPGPRVFAGSWGTDAADPKRKRRKDPRRTVVVRKITRVRVVNPKNKGRNTGASQVTKKKKAQTSPITNPDQGGGLSGVTNGPAGLDGGLFDSLTSTLGSFARLAVLAIIIYVAWKYGRKYLR